jgi:protein-arginine kinase activator protein McsA
MSDATSLAPHLDEMVCDQCAKPENEMNIAQQIAETNHYNAADVMEALTNVEGDQDWENESTTWTFEDGSKIVVCGSSVEIV